MFTFVVSDNKDQSNPGWITCYTHFLTHLSNFYLGDSGCYPRSIEYQKFTTANEHGHASGPIHQSTHYIYSVLSILQFGRL